MIMKIIQIKICGMQLKAMFREIFINNSFGEKSLKLIIQVLESLKRNSKWNPKKAKGGNKDKENSDTKKI